MPVAVVAHPLAGYLVVHWVAVVVRPLVVRVAVVLYVVRAVVVEDRLVVVL